MAVETVRFYLMAQRAFIAAFAGKIAESILDIRGGGADTFNTPLQIIGNGAQVFDGASWVMPVKVGHKPALTGDWEDWINAEPDDWMFGPQGYLAIADAIPGPPLQVNTGEQNVKLVIYAEYETALLGSGDPLEQWMQSLADKTRKPNALEDAGGDGLESLILSEDGKGKNKVLSLLSRLASRTRFRLNLFASKIHPILVLKLW